ncbi:glycosyltransferase family 90 protein [Xylariaceae sp. FL0016]|nr:glycosyltransferase family 90 protein [Xylariaceae sp. FL0016]
MAPLQRQRYGVPLTLCIFTIANAYLDTRYNRSAAFERPVHLSVVVLLLTGLALYSYSRYFLNTRHSYHLLESATGALRSFPSRLSARQLSALFDSVRSWARDQSSFKSFALLLFCILCRTLLFWRTIRTIHCSWDGILAFLPFFLGICHVLDLQPLHLPKHSRDEPFPRTTLYRYITIAFLWALAVTTSFQLGGQNEGAICPAGWCVERLTPLMQLLVVFLDSYLITQFGTLCNDQEGSSGALHTLGTLSLSSAGVLMLVCVFVSSEPRNFIWNFLLSWLEVRDLLMDGLTATVIIISGVLLSWTLHPFVVALLFPGISALVLFLSNVADGTLKEIWSGFLGVIAGLAVFLGFGVLLHLGMLQSGPPPQRESSVSKNRYSLGALATFVMLFIVANLGAAPAFQSSPSRVIEAGTRESDSWIAAAGKSSTLQAAVEEYRKRYDVPPPPNFDKWYEFATSVNSPIIDTFDQINSDLLPFWGTVPALLRQRTTHLLEHPSLSIGGVIIENGTVDISPHVHGTHGWMLSIIREMVEPFVQWIPDMQLAFNLDDECRISVPFDRMQAYLEEAENAKGRLRTKDALLPFSSQLEPPWSTDFLEAGDGIWDNRSPWFYMRSFSPIFYEWVSTTCAADAPVNRHRWWNRKARCDDCAAPHTTDGFLSNWTLAGDLCHQPDLAYLHGFLASPAAMAPSNTLFPVFSQSRVHNFADILYPSPWSFGEKVTYEAGKDVAWNQKQKSVFWRGASSDGFATHGAWQMFLRARFVYRMTKAKIAQRATSLLHFVKGRSDSPPSVTPADASSSPAGTPATLGHVDVDVSFVGNFSRCDERDCAAEHTTFYGSNSATAPPPVDFQESWKHRHLVDLDGAAFSGRFLPFLESRSLPYRAGLFRSWWEERVHAWRHYVPVDVRLHDLWGALGYFGGGGGDREGEEMARAGAEWARKALRKEDMQVYMFRLLLEWGRIIDDRREDLGYVFEG